MVTDNTNITTTDYAGNYSYENGSLKFINHPEGYIEPDSAGEYAYVYQYKDHLGNIRLSYSDANGDGIVEASEIRSEKNYYPFGLQHKGYNNVVNGTEHPYMFQGVEYNESLDLNLYEMDFRQYDPALGRFNTSDPLGEERNWLSPYNFVQNNPILRIDPSGLLDDYGIDQNGNIHLLKETDDTTDTLYSVTTDENGELVKNDSGEVNINDDKGSVTINKYKDGSSILSDLSTENTKTVTMATGEDTTEEINTNITHTDGTFKDDVFKVFKFAADNSNVEWSLHKFSVMDGTSNYQIGTYHLNNLSPGFNNQGVGTWLGGIHSHPNQNTRTARIESMFGDRSVGRNYLRKYGSNLPYMTYFPSTGTASRIRLFKDPLFPNAVKIQHGINNYKF